MSFAKTVQSVLANLVRWAGDRTKGLSQALDWLTAFLKRMADSARISRDWSRRMSQDLDRLATRLEPSAG